VQISSVQPSPDRTDTTRRTPTITKRIVVATALGNGLEIFDFTVYSFFAAYIGSAFFPAHDPVSSLLLAVGTFGVGFFARPVGALLLGSYADRVGRRDALTLSILLMAIGTCLISLCPTYEQIGWAAPVLIVGGRILQGFAAGGEVGTATTWLMESGSQHQRGFMVGWQMVSQGIASVIGALCGYALSHALAPDALAAWGWRVPFAIGTLIAPVGFYIRRHLPDSCHGSAQDVHRHPLGELWADHRSNMLAATGLTTGQTVTMYVMVFYMPSYLTRVIHLPASTGFATALGASIAFTIFAFIGGLVADRCASRKTLVQPTFILSTAACLPALWIVTRTASPAVVVTTVMVIAALLGFGVVATLLLMMELFPANVRATAFSTTYALANTLFGGTAQFVVTALIARTGQPFSAAWYVAACDLIALVTVLRVRERHMN
jgi:MFS transporter, MHS family, proline/betaine transporter